MKLSISIHALSSLKTEDILHVYATYASLPHHEISNFIAYSIPQAEDVYHIAKNKTQTNTLD